jgi:putative aminopeptidase FrvX
MELENIELLKQLVKTQGLASDEGKIKEFILKYVESHSKQWKTQPIILQESWLQDNIVLIFGTPKTAIYAHIDTIGYSAGYADDLIRVGGPRNIEGTLLVGSDSDGELEAEVWLNESEDGHVSPHYVCDRAIDRGTLLSFKNNFRETDEYVQSSYLDNRLGVFSALEVAKTLENGAIVFSTYEEHGGNSVGFIAKYLFETYGVQQALISDITWVTPYVNHGGGVAISMRDSMLPRRSFLNRIIDLAEKSGIQYQLEVESAGGSDGSVLQKASLPIDWCFIGAAEDNVHTPDEKVFKSDILTMIQLYEYLMRTL